MTQHINLLKSEKRTLNPLALALFVWGVCVLLIVTTWGVNKFRVEAAKASLEVAKHELSEARELVKKRADAKAALDAEIATLTPQAAAAKQLLAMASDMGTHTGYSPLYTELARLAPDDLWLTDIHVARSGKSLSVGGAALNRESILSYTTGLNTSLSNKSYQFSALEMTPLSIGIREGGKPAMTSTKFVLR